jgi:putative heme-binding domain-containing protein
MPGARFLSSSLAPPVRWLVVWGCTIAALAASPNPCSGQSRLLTDASPSEIASGKEIFDAQCAPCHGAVGAGGTGPDLRRPTLFRAKDDEGLIAVIRNGVPGTSMPFAILSLSEPMIWQTAAYVRSLGRVAPEPIKGNSERGAQLFNANGCATCHAISGKGGVLGPDLSVVGVQRGAIALRQSLTDPGAEHQASYLVVKAVHKSGVQISGIRLDEDVFWVSVRDASGRLHTLPKADLVQLERKPNDTLMPSYAALAEADLDDLVAYLATLKGPK